MNSFDMWLMDSEYCYSCCVAPALSWSNLCEDCQQEQDDELQDHYDGWGSDWDVDTGEEMVQV